MSLRLRVVFGPTTVLKASAYDAHGDLNLTTLRSMKKDYFHDLDTTLGLYWTLFHCVHLDVMSMCT